MRVIIQRVSSAKVEVEGEIVGKINRGYVLLVGFEEKDNEEIIRQMINKIINLRIFEDNKGKMNLALNDLDYEILSIPQFTLYANTTNGRRPSFVEAASFAQANALYNYFNKVLGDNNIKYGKGVFGANMQVSLTNDGPVTIMLDSKDF